MSIGAMLATLGSETTSQLIAAWITVSLKGSVLVVVAWIMTRTLRRGSAAMRHAIWTSALAGMLMLPLLAVVVPAIRVGGVPDVRVPRAVVAEPRAAAAEPEAMAIEHATAATTTAPAIREVESIDMTAAPRFHVPIDAWIPLALILGLTILLIRALAGAFQLTIWTKRARAVHDAGWLSLVQRLAHGMGITRPVTLLRSERACVPMTWGVVYPRVLLPVDADNWTSERRTIVLLHELAHVKRLDAFTQLVAQISVAVFWFNPVVWLAARQMRIEREHACDDCVLDAGARASDYAQDLLQIARSLMTSPAPAAAALAMARRTELEGRLLAILSPRLNRRPTSRKRIVASSFGVLAMALPLAAVRPTPRIPQPQLTQPATVSTPTTPTVVATTPVASAAPRVSTPVGHAPELAVPATTLPPLHEPTATPATSATTSISVAPLPTSPTRVGAVTPIAGAFPPDLETLIAVARAARKMTSDLEKGELLIVIAKHYVRDDELRTAYLDAVATMTSDYERTRALQSLLLKDSLPMKAVAQVVRIASMMVSDNDKANLVVRTVMEHPSLTPAIRAALISTMATMRSDYDRGRSIAAIVRRGDLSNVEAMALINATKAMTSDYTKANTLLLIATKHPISDPDLRRAYLSAAESMTSASDYRRTVVRVLE